MLKLVGAGVLLSIALSTCNACNAARRDRDTRAAVERIDSVVTALPTYGRLDTAMRAEGLRTSIRSLYGNNAVVRTKERPDDLMNEWARERDELLGQ